MLSCLCPFEFDRQLRSAMHYLITVAIAAQMHPIGSRRAWNGIEVDLVCEVETKCGIEQVQVE